MESEMGTLWSLLTVIGPLLLAGAILWALLRNRARERPEDIARSEQGARELRDRIDHEDKSTSHMH